MFFSILFLAESLRLPRTFWKLSNFTDVMSFSFYISIPIVKQICKHTSTTKIRSHQSISRLSPSKSIHALPFCDPLLNSTRIAVVWQSCPFIPSTYKFFELQIIYFIGAAVLHWALQVHCQIIPWHMILKCLCRSQGMWCPPHLQLLLRH